MACDSFLTDGNTVQHVRKVFRKKGHVVGIAGDYAACMDFITWWLRGGGPEYEGEMQEVDVLILTAKGKILHYGACAKPYELEDNFAAIGSGSAAAMGAMHMGATPAQAVRAASKVDVNTGGKISIRRRGKGNGGT
jgi:ATP-dependent protease HslVU (ClpYQ) peptidase subunit